MTVVIERVVAGFQTIEADSEAKGHAIDNLGRWLTDAEYASCRPQLEWLIAEGRWSHLLDAFYQVLPFGTGGRRGAVGIGPNRMNLWTLGSSVQGHCEYLREKFPGVESLAVVLAYDVRRFLDKSKVYNPGLPNPTLGLSSRDLAHHAAGIYAANGVRSLIQPPDCPRYTSTPELSFAIRRLRAQGGINVTASHNPPDDNGNKFYDERGAQPVPPDDQIQTDIIERVTTVRSVSFADAVRTGRVRFLDDAIHASYIDLCCKQSLIEPPRFDEVQIVFTPLHGVGGTSAMEVLAAQGFRPIPVPDQMTPDGQFPNVTKSPNPEVPESMDRAEVVAREHGADLVLATDPDADRLGALAADGCGGFRYINGNELSALITWFKLDQLAKQGRLPQSPLVVTTAVTTSLVTRIARHYGAQVVNNLLVGFKHMAEVLRQLEDTGRFEDIIARPDDLVMATEESHGVLATAEMRDKDSSCGCLLMAELALDCKRHGQTVVDALEELARRFGYYRNELMTVVLPGLEGKERMARMLDRLRSDPPREIAGLAVTEFEDLRDPNGRMGPIRGSTDAAGRNVLIFRCGEAARVALRPSGTEPKAKAYLEVCTPPKRGMPDADWLTTCRHADKLAQQVADQFMALAMSRAGLAHAGRVPLGR
ncbi:MAG: phospho-sugar mutase [Gemmataceae bacterium]